MAWWASGSAYATREPPPWSRAWATGCEYMTGGQAVVLGPTGLASALGCPVASPTCSTRTGRSSPGSAHRDGGSRGAGRRRHDLVAGHPSASTSRRQGRRSRSGLLGRWHDSVRRFRKIVPRDYKRVLQGARLAEARAEASAKRSWEQRMADPKGFLKHGRELPVRRPVPVRLLDWNEVYEPLRPRICRPRHHDAWTAASRSATTAARWATSSPTGTISSTATVGATPSSDCTPRTTFPSSPAVSAQRRARRRACSASTRIRSRSSRSRCRSSIGLGMRDGSHPSFRTSARASGSRWSVRVRGPRHCAAGQGRARGRGVRACRPHRRAPALRHPRVQDGEASPRPQARPDAARGRGVPSGRRGGYRSHRRAAARRLRRRRAGRRSDGLARPAGAGRQLHGIHQAMEFLPWANRAQEGDLGVDDVPIHGQGQARRDHRRRRHRSRLPRHVTPAGRRLGAPTRDHAPTAGRAARCQSLADLADDHRRVSSAHEEGGEH